MYCTLLWLNLLDFIILGIGKDLDKMKEDMEGKERREADIVP